MGSELPVILADARMTWGGLDARVREDDGQGKYKWVDPVSGHGMTLSRK